MSQPDLMRFILGHHANWMRTANQLAASASSQPSDIRRVKSQLARRVRKNRTYWKSKCRAIKEKSDHTIQELVKRADPYIRSKRRKVSSFQFRFSTFGGYRLALARNIGHCSASATLAMLEADSSHRQTLVRWERLLAASVLSDQRHFHARAVNEPWCQRCVGP